MKRRSLIILLFLVVGAIVNVAVATTWHLRGASLYWQAHAPTHPLTPNEVIALWRPPLLIANVGTVIAVAFAAPCCAIALRRCRRIKRGLCPKCAYDLRGTTSGACPECGMPVTPRSDETELNFRSQDLRKLRHPFLSIASGGYSFVARHRKHLRTAFVCAVIGAATTFFGGCIVGLTTRSEAAALFGVVSMPIGAALAVLAFAAVCFAHPRRRRIKHGHCPNCGYDLRASTKTRCSECGAVITSKAVPSLATERAGVRESTQ